MSARIGRHGRRINSTGNLGRINLGGLYADIRDCRVLLAIAQVRSYGDLRSSELHSGRTVQPHHEYR